MNKSKYVVTICKIVSKRIHRFFNLINAVLGNRNTPSSQAKSSMPARAPYSRLVAITPRQVKRFLPVNAPTDPYTDGKAPLVSSSCLQNF